MASSEPGLPVAVSTATPPDVDWEFWLYLTCGIAGAFIVALSGVVICLIVLAKKQKQRIKMLHRAAAQDNEAFQPEQPPEVDDEFQDIAFVEDEEKQQIPSPLGPPSIRQTIVQERTVTQQKGPPTPSSYYDDDQKQVPAAAVTVAPSSRVVKEDRRPTHRDDFDERDIDEPQRRRVRPSGRRPESGLPPLRPDDSWDMRDPDRRRNPPSSSATTATPADVRPSARQPRPQPGTGDRYDQEMRDYKPRRPAAGNNTFDDETASAVFPRIHRVVHKRTSSIPDRINNNRMRETSVDNPSRGGPMPFNYLQPGGSDGKFRLSGRASRETEHRRPLSGELSEEEFSRRRGLIEQTAVRNNQGGSPPRDARRGQGYDVGQFVRGGPGRASTSLSPSRYPGYPDRRN
uniref:Putative Ycf66-like protein n=1 Tax=Hypsibius dujardini TaxID=232323 RepID=A0A0U3BL26_HYPDU|nr:putative Ycf66-like protein [Hypsibius dujardini]